MLAVKHFRHYLYTATSVTFTEHEALKALINTHQPSGKLARRGPSLRELDLEIHHHTHRAAFWDLSYQRCPRRGSLQPCSNDYISDATLPIDVEKATESTVKLSVHTELYKTDCLQIVLHQRSKPTMEVTCRMVRFRANFYSIIGGAHTSSSGAIVALHVREPLAPIPVRIVSIVSRIFSNWNVTQVAGKKIINILLLHKRSGSSRWRCCTAC